MSQISIIYHLLFISKVCNQRKTKSNKYLGSNHKVLYCQNCRNLFWNRDSNACRNMYDTCLLSGATVGDHQFSVEILLQLIQAIIAVTTLLQHRKNYNNLGATTSTFIFYIMIIIVFIILLLL
jgi:hypothetical protein